jgi:hypothetical protein
MTTTITQLHPIATIQLIGSYTALHVESGTSVDLTARRNRSTTKSPIPILSRELLAHGLDPETRAHVVRTALDRDGFIPVFKRDRSLAVWAGLDAVESETRSVHVEKHRPYRGPVKGSKGQEVAEATSDTPESQPQKYAATATRQTAMGEAA